LYIWNCRRKVDKEVTPQNFFELLGNHANKLFDFSDLSYYNIVDILKYLKGSCARWLCLSPTMAYQYAVVASKLNIKFENIKYLELQGEYVDSERRSYIEKAFGARTILQYGMRETWTIAYECPHGHLRVLSDLYQIELLNIDEMGYGEVVLSSNVNKHMPFIKYRTGDRARIKVDCTCKCGYKNPYIIEIGEGRKANRIIGHDNLIADIVFKRIIRKSLKPYNYDASRIKSFGVLQTDKNEFVYSIVPGENYCKDIETFIITNTKKLISDNVVVKFVYNDVILLNENGKQQLYRHDFEGEKNEKV
jgi:phenylacetate-CoA ligase